MWPNPQEWGLKILGLFGCYYTKLTRDDTFPKIFFVMEELGMFLLYVKRYFQLHQWCLFFFRPQNTRILIFLLMPVWEISRIIVWEQKISKNIFALKVLIISLWRKKNIFNCISEVFISLGSKILGFLLFCKCRVAKDQRSQFENKKNLIIYFGVEILGRCLPRAKKYFQLQKLKFFFRYASKGTDFVVFAKLVWKRPKTTVWEQTFFKNIFCSRHFSQGPAYRKKVFPTA